MTVIGTGASEIDGGGTKRHFRVAAGGELQLYGLALRRGHHEEQGGSILVEGTLSAEHCSFSENSAATGGAVFVNSADASASFAHTTFTGNVASVNGGAIVLDNLGRLGAISSCTFTENRAEGNFSCCKDGRGGAIYLINGSVSDGMVNSNFFRNSATGLGGAISFLSSDTSEAFTINACSFEDNYATHWGGAVVLLNSDISSIESSTFSNNTINREVVNTDDHDGGAVLVYSSNISRVRNCTFINNRAPGSESDGGAISFNCYYGGGLEELSGNTFEGNYAGRHGGAYHSSKGTFGDISNNKFLSNVADGYGGGMCLLGGDHSSIKSCQFSNNSATNLDTGKDNPGLGGGIAIFNTTVEAIESSNFTANRAYGGGAIHISSAASVRAVEKCIFTGNSALGAGGAVQISYGSNLTSVASSEFSSNTAGLGGAIALFGGHINVISSAIFAANHAIYRDIFADDDSSAANLNLFRARYTGNGGAIFVQLGSVIGLLRDSNFSANNGETSGGALYLVGELEHVSGSNFSSNRAGGSGGAINSELSLTDIYITATGFHNNKALGGGGGAALGPLKAFAEKKDGGVKVTTPVMHLADCTFEANAASDIGGAVGSIAIVAFACNFVNNTAGEGGALWADTSLNVSASDFTNNSARSGGAISSKTPLLETGGISTFTNNKAAGSGGALFYAGANQYTQPTSSKFEGNKAGCCYSPSHGDNLCADVDGQQNALDVCCTFEQYSDHELCPQCPEGFDCSEVGHVPSTIPLHRGYWRAQFWVMIARKCLYPKACEGKLDSEVVIANQTAMGSDVYCSKGYRGPMCAVCEENYGGGLGYRCENCKDGSRAGILAAALCSLLLVGFVAWYANSKHRSSLAGSSSEAQGPIQTLIAVLPFGTLRIVIVVFQIITQFVAITGVRFPPVYERFLAVMSVLNLDLGWVLSVGCITNFSFYDRLLLITLGPMAVLVILGCSYRYSLWRTRSRAANIREPGNLETPAAALERHVSMAFLFSFLIYSTVSTVIFQTFSCDSFDLEEGGGSFLRADYSISCREPRHDYYKMYAFIMAFVYPFGIPTIYAWSLWRQRKLFEDPASQLPEDGTAAGTDPRCTTAFLWRPYKASHFWWEVVECGRRLLLTGIIVFIRPNTVAQVAVACVLAVLSMAIFALNGLPLRDRRDGHIYIMGCGIIFLSMFLACMVKSESANVDSNSQTVLAALLIVLSVLLVVAAIAQCILVALQVRSSLREEAPSNDIDRFNVLSKWRAYRRSKSSSSSSSSSFGTERTVSSSEYGEVDAETKMPPPEEESGTAGFVTPETGTTRQVASRLALAC